MVSMAEHPSSPDPDRQQRARHYARLRRRIWAIELSFVAGYLALWVFGGWAGRLLAAFERALAPRLAPTGLAWWAELVLVAAALGTPAFLLSLPLRYYQSFVLPHRFGLSTQTRRGWLMDLVKGTTLSVAIGGPLLLGLYALLRLAPRTWWLWASVGLTLFGALLTAASPLVLMPIFFKFKPLAQSHQDLARRLRGLARSAGTQVEGVFAFDMSRRTRAANAALVGLGRTRRILLGDTLLAEFTPEEVETIVGHELGHHVHRDIPLYLLAQAAFNLTAFWICHLGLQALAPPLGLRAPADPAGLPLLGLILGLVGYLSLPLGNGLSRWRERLADEFAVSLTRQPEAYASALRKLADQNLSEFNPPRWAVILLHSHPPLGERIRRALARGT
jgi:STE24 endopeptidase